MAKKKERTLFKSEVIQGTTWQPGTSIRFDVEGNLEKVVLGADQKIMDVKFAASMPDVFKKGTALEYARAGSRASTDDAPDKVIIHEKHTIMGFVLPAETSLQVGAESWNTGGKDTKYTVTWIQAALSAEADIKGKHFNAGDWFIIHPGNKVVYYDNGKETTL